MVMFKEIPRKCDYCKNKSEYYGYRKSQNILLGGSSLIFVCDGCRFKLLDEVTK